MTHFDKKTVYHSDLVKADGLTLQLKGDVRKGKYGLIVPINVMGDPPDHDYWLAVENDGCADVLRSLPKSTWHVVHAAGSRASASLSASPLQGGPGVPQQPQVPQAAVQELDLEVPPEVQVAPSAMPLNLTSTTPVMPDLQALLTECMLEAGAIVDAFQAHRGRAPSQVDQDLAVTLFIEKNKRQRGY